MYIDDCEHTFDQLARAVLPKHMERLRVSLKHTHAMAEFGADGAGTATLVRRVGVDADFSGCYVLVDCDRPVYVGISRKVLSRLRQHVRGRSHFDASLAYAVAQRRCPTPGFRDTAMQVAEFQQAFENARSYLRGLAVGFVEIENPVELYLFEVYAAMELGTHEWNTFRTH